MKKAVVALSVAVALLVVWDAVITYRLERAIKFAKAIEKQRFREDQRFRKALVLTLARVEAVRGVAEEARSAADYAQLEAQSSKDDAFLWGH